MVATGPRRGDQASWEVDADKPKPKGETRARRSYCTTELTHRPGPGIDTVHDIILYAGRTHGDKNGWGTREVMDVITEEHEVTRTVGNKVHSTTVKKEFLHLSPLQWMSYEQVLWEVRTIGSGLRQLGIGTAWSGKGRSKSYFNLYAKSSASWMLMAQACAFNAVPICTLYDTLATEDLLFSLNEASVLAMFTNADLLNNIERIIAKTPSLQLIVYDGTPEPGLLEKFAWCKDVKLVHIDEVRRLGMQSPHQAIRAKRDDVFCCMYTSGGGGRAKGVLLTHGNICSAVGSVNKLVGEVLADHECYLAFLPQAHIFEFVVEMTFMFIGIPIAYGRTATLSDAGVRHCKNDIMEARPSIMVAVPQVWDLLRKGIVTKVDASGKVKKKVFDIAVKAKSAAMEHSIPGVAGVTNALVFNQVKSSTGGRLRLLFSGGARVSTATQKFLSAALVKMVQGYGLTEGTAMACINHPNKMAIDTVGGPVPGCEIKLVDRPEPGLEYLSTDNPPRGEIYIRGPAVFKGYYKRPHLDVAAFTQDGWFRTGDIGQWNKDGTLSILDRVLNHVSLAGGKHIALERLEAVYKGCQFVGNGCLIANEKHSQPCMIVTPHAMNLQAFLKKHAAALSGVNLESSSSISISRLSLSSSTGSMTGSSITANTATTGTSTTSTTIPDIDIEELCSDPQVVRLCLQELNAVGKREGLKPNELLEALVLVPDEWTPESGMLTAAQKLRRMDIASHYQDQVNKVYKHEPDEGLLPLLEDFPAYIPDRKDSAITAISQAGPWPVPPPRV
ncbi:long-chain fatty acid-CoA ligase [Vanrija albida]|uniref:Long-chain fatty acid-CoA ligase n=1 Tax=Vanrija albida TaxID=181172 RepID=A0ABR3Q3P1_9TREE